MLCITAKISFYRPSVPAKPQDVMHNHAMANGAVDGDDGMQGMDDEGAAPDDGDDDENDEEGDDSVRLHEPCNPNSIPMQHFEPRIGH